MAGNQVGARMEGDMYQGLFFWDQASYLLDSKSPVCKVDIEYDAVPHVDDVVVFYDERGKNDCGEIIQAEYFQIKYHVDQSRQYSSDALISPAFINAKTSLLQRFRRAYDALKEANQDNFTLCLASNWAWDASDDLGPLIREDDGRLPPEFLSASPKSSLKKIRETWRKHLGYDNGPDFQSFLSSLRIKCDYFGRRDFQKLVSQNLQLNGLKPYTNNGRGSLYDSLYLRFITDRTRSFDRDSFHQMCISEGLLDPVTERVPVRQPAIGIRSFRRFAERMEDDCDDFVCVAEFFDGRYPLVTAGWDTSITPKVVKFLEDPSLRAKLRREGHLLYLDCHASLALLAGYELDRKSGVSAWPVQKGSLPSTWIPKGAEDPTWGWSTATILDNGPGDHLGLAISATHDVRKDIESYLVHHKPMFRKVVSLIVNTGVGPSSIHGPDHAIKLADEVAQAIRSLRQTYGGSTLHLWAAVPNALLFYLGQHREALGDIQMHEVELSGARGSGYVPSIHFPI